MVSMQVDRQRETHEPTFRSLLAEERRYSQDLQRRGVWKHLWRVVGRHANYSVFDVADHEELHDLLCELPLFPYLTIEVQALADHPSAAAATRGIASSTEPDVT